MGLRQIGAMSAASVGQAIASKATSSRLYTQMAPMPGDTRSATTTAEQIYASQYLVPADSLVAGQAIHVKGAGVYTTTAVLPPTQRARLRLGGQTLVDTGAQGFPVSLSSSRYMYDLTFIVRSIGVNGTIEAFGKLDFATSLTTAITVLCGPSGTIGDAGNPVTVDTTVDMPLQLSCTFGAVLAGNSNTMRQISVHTLRPVS